MYESLEPTSHSDCGVPGCWFSHTIGLAHEAGALMVAEDADALGARAVRAQAMSTETVMAIKLSHRFRPRILIRANGVADFERAAPLFTVTPTPDGDA